MPFVLNAQAFKLWESALWLRKSVKRLQARQIGHLHETKKVTHIARYGMHGPP